MERRRTYVLNKYNIRNLKQGNSFIILLNLPNIIGVLNKQNSITINKEKKCNKIYI